MCALRVSGYVSGTRGPVAASVYQRAAGGHSNLMKMERKADATHPIEDTDRVEPRCLG